MGAGTPVTLTLVLLLAAVPPQCKNWPAKPAWEWTLEERLDHRFDRTCLTGRRLWARAKPAADFVQGQDTPELFLPTELFDALLRTPRAAIFDRARAAGVQLPANFFVTVEEHARDYIPGHQSCAARAAALGRVRKAFGGTSFDRFLYTIVAPNLTMSGDDNRARKAWFERGCR